MSQLEYILQDLNKERSLDILQKPITKNPKVISKQDVMIVLRAYLSHEVSYQQLLDWVNLILFSDNYTFSGDELRDYLDRIEESDEPGRELSDSEVTRIIQLLQKP